VTVRLATGVLDAIVAHAEETDPAECCGILLGRGGDIVEAIRTRNLDPDPTRFLIDPKDHFNALRRARASGVEVVGFYHSHPHSDPLPSATDLAEASYPEHLYLIVSLRGARAARLYRFQAGEFRTVAFEHES
jgi:proteasome lid subunit RPN8/RPN11